MAGNGLTPDEFRRHGYAVIDRIAAYLAEDPAWPVLARVRPGALRAALPASPPAAAETMDAVLEDFDRLILPATTHWNHPGFFAYFAISAPGEAVLAEALAAALNVNAMLWRTGPAATELEAHTLDWLRQLLGLPAGFEGTINDTASTSTLYALAAARELAPELRLREDGLAGRADLPRLRVYCSAEAHSSVDKAAITLGLGLEGVRRIAVDDEFRLDPAALAAAIAEDRTAGVRPLAVVATVGTTATTAVDPVPAIAGICEREGLWLHVDAAYGGAAAVVPELRHVLDGVDRAHSVVVNPHKWLFVPMDCSALYCQRPELLRRAFRHTPEYLETPEQAAGVPDLMDHGVALGRRFRALKLWFVLRRFGAEGLAAAIREHIRMARSFADWVDASPRLERLAPVNFSVVLFRRPPASADEPPELTDARNEALLASVNASGEAFLSHTRVRGRFALRLAVGNLRTRVRHVRRAFELADDPAFEPAGHQAG